MRFLVRMKTQKDKFRDRKELRMMKKHNSHILRSALSVLLAVSLLVGAVPAVFAANAGGAGSALQQLEISGINKLDNNAIINNFLQYLNGDVAFRLPEGVQA